MLSRLAIILASVSIILNIITIVYLSRQEQRKIRSAINVKKYMKELDELEKGGIQ